MDGWNTKDDQINGAMTLESLPQTHDFPPRGAVIWKRPNEMDMQACLSKTFLSLYAYIMETAQFHRWWVFWGLKGKSAPVFMRTYIYIHIYIYIYIYITDLLSLFHHSNLGRKQKLRMWESAGVGSHAGPSAREWPSDAWHCFQDMRDWKALRFKDFGTKHLREWNRSLIYMDVSTDPLRVTSS